MAVKMHFGYKTKNNIDDISNINEVGFETLMELGMILVCHIIGEDDMSEIFGCCKRSTLGVALQCHS